MTYIGKRKDGEGFFDLYSEVFNPEQEDGVQERDTGDYPLLSNRERIIQTHRDREQP